MWQNVLGAISIAVNFFSCVGIFFIAVIYAALTISGGKGPGEAFRGLLKACAWLLIVELAVGGVVLLVVLANSSGQ